MLVSWGLENGPRAMLNTLLNYLPNTRKSLYIAHFIGPSK